MKEMGIEIRMNDGWYKAIISNVRSLSETPKSYKNIGYYFHNIGNSYNSKLMTLYKVKNGLRFSMFRDGCFYKYYGKIVLCEKLNK